MSCGVGCGRGSDPTLLWLCGSGVGWAVAALIQPLAWEPSYAAGAAQEMAKRQKKKKKKKEEGTCQWSFMEDKRVTKEEMIVKCEGIDMIPTLIELTISKE